MDKSMTVLLTGGTGFLGSNLLRRLVAEKFEVVLLLRSTSDSWRISGLLPEIRQYRLDQVSLEEIFRNETIDSVIHCATNYGRREVDITTILEANLILPLQLLQLARKHSVRSFINTDTILDKRVNNYSLSKGQFKEWLKRFSDEICCVNVALEHFFGPLDDRTKFVTFIIQSLLTGDDLIPLTPGAQKRDFIFVDDVVDAFLAIIYHARGMRQGYFSYELGTGRNIEIREFVRLVKTMSGNNITRLDFGALPYRHNEVMESHVDLVEITQLGWRPLVTIEEGLRKTIDVERGAMKR